MSGTFSARTGFTRRDFLVAGGATTALLALAACGTSGDTASSSSGPQQRGGRLRVGFIGGGDTETLNPFNGLIDVDFARQTNIFDGFVRPTDQAAPENALVESFEPNADAKVWTLRLRSGVQFHDGKSLTADDAIYSLRQAALPQSTNIAAGAIDVANIQKLDDLTLRVPLHHAIADLPGWLMITNLSIVLDGTSAYDRPIGTGPFMFESWTKGRESLLKRNPNYWQSPYPYVDELVFQSIPNDTTRLNALLAGQIDAVISIPPAAAQQYTGDRSPINVMIAKGPSIVPMTMAVDIAPFDDVRVRQAMRLIADRDALVNNVTLGNGQVGNDLFGQGLALYNDALPQRKQDLDQAKSLLKAAGRDGLTVQLNTSPASAGMLESATLFAQQARQAGVNVQLNQLPANTYFNPPYLQWAFGQDYFQAFQIPTWLAATMVSTAPYNTTHWQNPDWDRDFYDALGDVEDSSRKDKFFALQETLYDQGGMLIWGTAPWVDALSKRVQGARPNTFANLSAYRFDQWSLTT